MRFILGTTNSTEGAAPEIYLVNKLTR